MVCIMYYKYSKPKPTAVSLTYDREKDKAPRISATGKGELAKQIIKLAKQHNIPIHEDKDLVAVLSLLEVNTFIPVEVYAIVAKILSHIYQYKKNKI